MRRNRWAPKEASGAFGLHEVGYGNSEPRASTGKAYPPRAHCNASRLEGGPQGQGAEEDDLPLDGGTMRMSAIDQDRPRIAYSPDITDREMGSS